MSEGAMFWKEKTLSEMNSEEWESLCDGCGRCCVWKFEDEDSGEVLYTDIRCRLFNDSTCRCTDYANRTALIPECINIRKLSDAHYAWLPESCAYRLLHEGKPLFEWHHLISGSRNSVHEAGISLHKKTICGENFTEEDIVRHIIDPDEING
ncbi:hypothetical protein Ga0123462_1855 [Mariprofundus ferrinatatus]|uniref:Uncharacterized protein n=1 Tax=Mariprofundus ferrinatatus TaxID=1921087 RepID=A0A2K8L5V5_9PROT|nr:YcgN family cysteine cluster protein [Mariprofundus ferrinatatus]ATX82698.1 hypothetical protein Ga0123462_1855 [Mariprofundus ferrinatatus]